MENEFVSYEVALALKELGFDEECFKWYHNPDLLTDDELFLIYNNDNELFAFAPLKQQVFRWFREKYEWYANLSSWIHEPELGTYHEYEIYGNPNGVYGEGKYDTYEEAENACIDKLIELAKQDNDTERI
jgi:hypothetical protein